MVSSPRLFVEALVWNPVFYPACERPAKPKAARNPARTMIKWARGKAL
jgi:hypothetical protein